VSEIAKLLGERIRGLRKEKGLSQEVLGERADLHEKFISQVERGAKNLSLDSLIKIAKGLDVSLEEVFRIVDPIRRENDLSDLIALLSSKPRSDHAMMLMIAKAIFSNRQ
jgi:transcriptional regulator with XRE-family HTH domain